MKDITDFLVDEGSYEEEALLGENNDCLFVNYIDMYITIRVNFVRNILVLYNI